MSSHSASPNINLTKPIRTLAEKEETPIVSTNMTAHSTSPNFYLTEPIRLSTSKGKTLVVSTNMFVHSPSPNLDSFEDITAFINIRRFSQSMYRSTERVAKERKSEGKKTYLVEVKDGEPIGPNASRWAYKLGTRVRSHLDVTKANFSYQDERNVDQVI